MEEIFLAEGRGLQQAETPTKMRLYDETFRQLSFSVKNLDIGFAPAASLIGSGEYLVMASALL